ncbi:hypothetical protein [uncultured Eubacterium sp.]|uniref:hypothetical protein n=1 Tax=uncultured Eubacterium sp. TaxID=165185 RepID=UPI0025992F00|nr:hypothetical protein [uncultured Eubacterium sp.]
MTEYKEPYPTIGDVVKDKDYDYVSYRITYPENEDGEFAGCFSVKDNKIIPLDGDVYGLDEIVVASEEWSKPEDGIERGLTVIVKGTWLSNK